MKKLSMLAAGVAVLTMCACTEANEFTPSTNGNTKKITEIKVASNASALGTRTEFDTSTEKFGIVTWESGNDELHFFQNGNSGVHKTFVCGNADDEGPSAEYNWHYFNAKSNSDALDVDKSYYAYYFPYYEYTEEGTGKTISIKTDACNLQPVSCSKFYLDNTRETGNREMLKKFMHDYDLLQSTNVGDGSFGFVTATDPMDYIYMDHPFALITVNLECGSFNKDDDKQGMGDFTSYPSLPTFYQAEIQGLYDAEETSKCKNLFANSYQISSNGELIFTYNDYKKTSIPQIASVYNSIYYYLIPKNFSSPFTASEGTEFRNKLSFHFLVHQNEDPEMPKINLLNIFIDAESTHGSYHMDSDDKSISIHLTNGIYFEPGKSYEFDLHLDYGHGVTKTQPDNIYHNSYWADSKSIFLFKYPSIMEGKVESVEYGTR